jgi:hypothetical protein
MSIVFEAANVVEKIGQIIKPNHHNQIKLLDKGEGKSGHKKGGGIEPIPFCNGKPKGIKLLKLFSFHFYKLYL